jgi:hypothetical protein
LVLSHKKKLQPSKAILYLQAHADKSHATTRVRCTQFRSKHFNNTTGNQQRSFKRHRGDKITQLHARWLTMSVKVSRTFSKYKIERIAGGQID